MNLVDSSGWLEYFGKGKNSAFFAPVIQEIETLVVPTLSLYEVYKKIVLQRDEEEALSAMGWMAAGKIVDLTREIALAAAVLSLEQKLPMADSVILATAQLYNATLWTQDEHFKEIEGVKYIAKKPKA
jgi:predicted nucleic acid-binding protein